MDETKRTLRREEVQVLLQLEEDFLLALEREEIVVCDADGCYSASMLERVRLCQSLHDDLGVNFAGLDVAIRLIETIQAERHQFFEVLQVLRQELKAPRE